MKKGGSFREFLRKPKRKRKGVHSKNNNKKKKYIGQGR